MISRGCPLPAHGFRWCGQIVLLTVATTVDAQAPATRSPVPGAPAGVTAFVNVAVVPMDTERVLSHQTVLVQNGWVTALGPMSTTKVPAGATRIDGRGQYLIPGLADMHAHLFAGGISDSAWVERNLLRYVAYGVTTIRNMDHLTGGFRYYGTGSGSPPDPVLSLRARAAAGTLVSPRIYTAGQWGPSQYTTGLGARADTPGRLDSVATYLATYKAAGYDFLKPYSERRPIFDSVLVVARRLGLPLAGHIPTTDTSITLAQVLASGAYRSIEHLWGYGWEQQPFDLSTIPALATKTQRAGVWNTATLAVFAFASISPGAREVRRQLVKGLQDAGAGLLLGSDAVGVLGGDGLIMGFGVHQELIELVRAGLTPYQALATGTRNVAQYFGTLESTGTVAVRKRADLVLLSDNPLRDIRHAGEPAGVMLGGRWLDRDDIDRRLMLGVATHDGVIEWLLGGLLAPGTAAARQLTATHVEQRKLLIDSLGSDTASKNSRQRLTQLFADQLGAVRAALAPERREIFDVSARVWIRVQSRQGLRVTIPGVMSSQKHPR